jgi:hypothetical protein
MKAMRNELGMFPLHEGITNLEINETYVCRG